MVKTAPLSFKHITSLGMLALMMTTIATACFAQDIGLRDVSKNVGTNVEESIKIIPLIGYVSGTFFAASGLLKMKDWIIDGDKNSIVPVITRLLVATFLIMMPALIRITTGTFFQRSDGTMNTDGIDVAPPNIGAFCKARDPNCR